MDKDIRYLLVGDIGGTNCRLQLLEIKGTSSRVLKTEKYPTQDLPTFSAAINLFLESEKQIQV